VGGGKTPRKHHPGDGAAGSAPLLESILDEIHLLGPGVFEAARTRSLLRLFAADFAGREGAIVEDERLRDAVAEFRMRNGLEQDADFRQFLATNDLQAEDVERLIAAEKPVEVLSQLRGTGLSAGYR
jgi:hypothetical protein